MRHLTAVPRGFAPFLGQDAEPFEAAPGRHVVFVEVAIAQLLAEFFLRPQGFSGLRRPRRPRCEQRGRGCPCIRVALASFFYPGDSQRRGERGKLVNASRQEIAPLTLRSWRS
jgi:hypothetical protein